MIYECVNCGLTSPVKMGKCHKCNEWNCFEEKKESKKNKLKLLVSNKLSDLKTVSNEQIESSIIEMDRVLGGGFQLAQPYCLVANQGLASQLWPYSLLLISPIQILFYMYQPRSQYHKLI